MRCDSCDEPAVIDMPLRCKEHFLESFEANVRRTIEEHDLIRPGNRIAVAVSGGKDSLTILTLLRKWYPDVTAIAVDEGIVGYRDKTLAEARRVCDEHDIPLIIASVETFAGKTLDTMLKDKTQHPCTVCGALRRHLLAVASKGFDVLATGHNADDESQAVLMNIIKGNTELFPRLGPKTGVPGLGFTRRVKPLYFCTEREVLTYAFLKGFARGFDECPYASQSYRQVIRDELNRYAQAHPGVKHRILERFLTVKSSMNIAAAMHTTPCVHCGEPSSSGECKACAVMISVGARAMIRKT